MRITLSERQFSEQIRQLEGLGPEVTTEEIQHRIDRHARRLFDHIASYGIQMLATGFQVNGTLCTMSASLKPSYSEEDVQTRVQGIALLAPLSVSLDQPDLSAFVPNPIMLASMTDNWSAFSQRLQRLALSEVRETLENIAGQLISAPVAPPENEFEAELRQLEYEAFLISAGRKDPLRKHQQIAEYNAREEAAVAAAREAEQQRIWGNQD